MKPTYDEAAAALLAAIAPVAAYLERNTGQHAHALALETLLDKVADLGEAADARFGGPDWEAIALRMARYIEPTALPSPVAARTRAHLDTLKARAAKPLAERMQLARYCSHHLGTPDTL